jgi:hypothetical protein
MNRREQRDGLRIVLVIPIILLLLGRLLVAEHFCCQAQKMAPSALKRMAASVNLKSAALRAAHKWERTSVACFRRQNRED